MEGLERFLASVGKISFVEHFEEYRNQFMHRDDDNKKQLAAKLLKSNPKADSLQAQITRINAAIRIFENQLQMKALEMVIESKNKRITPEIKQRAKEIILQTKIRE